MHTRPMALHRSKALARGRCDHAGHASLGKGRLFAALARGASLVGGGGGSCWGRGAAALEVQRAVCTGTGEADGPPLELEAHGEGHPATVHLVQPLLKKAAAALVVQWAVCTSTGGAGGPPLELVAHGEGHPATVHLVQPPLKNAAALDRRMQGESLTDGDTLQPIPAAELVDGAPLASR